VWADDLQREVEVCSRAKSRIGAFETCDDATSNLLTVCANWLETETNALLEERATLMPIVKSLDHANRNYLDFRYQCSDSKGDAGWIYGADLVTEPGCPQLNSLTLGLQATSVYVGRVWEDLARQQTLVPLDFVFPAAADAEISYQISDTNGLSVSGK
jgi:hypothetical protein